MTLYSVGVRLPFIAQHFLTTPNAGAEGELHSHAYAVEVILEGDRLGADGYLVDIALVKRHLAELVDGYRDRTLNELAEFRGLNPSIEHLARLIGEKLAVQIEGAGLRSLTVKVYEDDEAWTAWRRELAS